MRPGANGTVTSCPASFAACSTAAQPPSTIRSASETFFPPDCAPLNSCWICSRVCSTVASSAGSLTSQSFCGARRMPRAVRAAALVGAAEARRRRPRGRRPAAETDSPEARILPFSAAMSASPISSWSTGGHRVLPQLRLRDPRAEVARDRAHVAVQQLVPGLGERVGELVRVLVEALARSARRPGRAAARGPSSASSARAASTGRARPARCPAPAASFGVHCLRAGRALGQLPLVAEQVLEEAVVPLGRRRWSRRPRGRW